MLKINSPAMVSATNSSHRRETQMMMFVGFLAATGILLGYGYSEIDWGAYMQQLNQIFAGERDYMKVYGETGPIVYPAGHVWIFSLFSLLTGQNPYTGQWLFLALYLVCLYLWIRIYQLSGLRSPWALLFSARLYLTFVAHLFNDCVCVLLTSLAIYSLIKHGQRRLGFTCVLYSLAVSVKMSAFLFAPGLLFVLVSMLGSFKRAASHILLYCAVPQLVLALPFLLQHPLNYLNRAFEFRRVFTKEETMNWAFLPLEVFVSNAFAFALLAATVGMMVVMWRRAWTPLKAKMKNPVKNPREVLLVLFSSNLVGITFARSIHLQFSTWYFYTLPALLELKPLVKSNSSKNFMIASVLLLALEISYHIKPAEVYNSVVMHIVHTMIAWTILK